MKALDIIQTIGGLLITLAVVFALCLIWLDFHALVWKMLATDVILIGACKTAENVIKSAD